MATACIGVAAVVAEGAASSLSGVDEPQAARPKTMMAAEIVEMRTEISSRLSERQATEAPNRSRASGFGTRQH
jgi:hypothetical protein